MMFVPALYSQTVDAKIVKVETYAFRAAKLGYRVHTELVVEREGKTYSISIPPYHTHMAGERRKAFQVGDVIRVKL